MEVALLQLDIAWEDPPEAPRVGGAVAVPAEVVALVADLAAVARAREAVPLAGLIPRRDAGESLLRASLLPLVGDGRAGEGIAGQLGAIAADVRPVGDGWPDPLEDGPLSALTPGAVKPRGR